MLRYAVLRSVSPTFAGITPWILYAVHTMSLGRAVPWASWAEWREVGLWLLSSSPAEVERGLERVAAWRIRGRVPLGVDSTACLVEAQQRDRAAAASAATSAVGACPRLTSQVVSESQLRLCYSLAVVRMVNGIADSSQRGRVAASVASLAAAAGLPRILVDLRHEATHNELPSLAALRLAAQHGLAWLQTNYWQRQSDHVHAAAGRVQALVQEYLSLHQAAAAKVAASAAADTSDEEQDDNGGMCAPPAEAAAASITTWRSASRRQEGGAQASAVDSTPPASTGQYHAADAKKRRRQLLAELRTAVPRPAARLLAEALLAASAAAAAEGGSKAPDGQNQAQPVQQTAGLDFARSEPAAPVDSTVAGRALAAAMGHLTAIWPQLPPLLLVASAQHMAAAAQAAGSLDIASIPPAHCLAWLRRLLPQPRSSQQAASPADSLVAACRGWVPTAALLQRLVAIALPAHAAASQQAACASLLTKQQKAKDDYKAAAAAALVQAVNLLATVLRSTQCGPGAHATVSSLLSLVSVVPTSAHDQAAEDPSDALAKISAAAVRQQALLQQLGQFEQTQGKQAGSLKRKSRGGQVALQSSNAANNKRWRRCRGWQPCALGMLPCSADPNGRLPALDALQAVQLPADFLWQQNEVAAAAARAVRPTGGLVTQQEAEVFAEPERLTAADVLPSMTAPWPALDRFTDHAVKAGSIDEGGFIGGDQGPRTQGFIFPVACSTLL